MKWRGTYFFYMGGYKIVNNEHLQHSDDMRENKITTRGSVVSVFWWEIVC